MQLHKSNNTHCVICEKKVKTPFMITTLMLPLLSIKSRDIITAQ